VSEKRPFDAVVSEHGATVLRVCRAVLGLADADDAWSETFLAAMRAYADLPADANIEAWLVTIAHRKAIDVTRATARAPIPMDAPPDTATLVSTDHPGTDPDLIGALQNLPPKQRQAIAYHYLGGLRYAEVAAIVGGSAAAARRAAADGIASLRRTGLAAAAKTVKNGEHDEHKG
jgi:RNA polymerase sigma factor (sigma-70 family)